MANSFIDRFVDRLIFGFGGCFVCDSGDECLPTRHGYLHVNSNDRALMQANYGRDKGKTRTVTSLLRPWLQLRFDFDSTVVRLPVRLQFDRATTTYVTSYPF